MDIELLTIQQDGFSQFDQQRNHNSTSFQDILIKETNVICHLIFTYQIIKLFLFLACYQETLQSPLYIAAFLVFIQDIITLFFYLILDSSICQFQFQELFKDEYQILNVFQLNQSLIFMTLQEILSFFRPMNGILLLYWIQQQMFKYPLILIRILYYFISVYYLIQLSNSSQENSLLINYQIIELVIFWILTLSIMIFIGVIIIINISLKKQIGFKFQNKFTVIKFQDLNQSFKDCNLDCSICFEQINEYDTIIQLSCHKKHIFHSQCFQWWLFQDFRCPLCRVEFECKNKYSIKVSYY